MSTQNVFQRAREIVQGFRLPKRAKFLRRQDRRFGLGVDIGIAACTQEAIVWLCNAQDYSRTRDGGVSRHFSLIDGWGSSYPETTGYIIPTFLESAIQYPERGLVDRARKMLDWLVSIQLPCGGFQGGTITSRPVVPVTFNTGQILLGLAAGANSFGEPYASALERAANWLVDTQDLDGCWRKNATPFAEPGEKTYETHVSWGLFEAARVSGRSSYAEAGLRNSRWALTKQHDNGWLADCCLSDASQPLTHTLGYALRGIVEAFRYSNDEQFLSAALQTAQGLQGCQKADGALPGRLNCHWQGTVDWVCLTGAVQIAHSWLLLYQQTQDITLLNSARLANSYVRRTLSVAGEPGVRGGIKGSFPIDGDYGKYEFLNWAAKFFIDSNRLEQKICN